MKFCKPRRSVISFFVLISMAGCVYVPASPIKRPSDIVGTDATAGIRIGETDRSTILQKLGEPSYFTEHQLAIGYVFYPTKGTWHGFLLGVCATPYVGSRDEVVVDVLWLQFDANGTLSRAQKGPVSDHKYTSDSWADFASIVPDRIHADTPQEFKP